MRTVAVVTVARSDYGHFLPILHRIVGEPTLRLSLIVAGMHLSPEFGLTVRTIEADGFGIDDRVEMLLSADTPSAIAKSVGTGIISFAQVFTRNTPDILLLLGDRFEMLAAATAMLPFVVPMAHVAGGEATEGLIDEAIRHSLTKMSHLHFVATERYRDRVIQMGEEPWRVVVSGAASLDNLTRVRRLTREETERRLDLPLSPPPLVVTFHPVTLQFESTEAHVSELLAALDAVDRPIVFTYPNADTYGRTVIERIDRYVATHPNARAVTSLGTDLYFSLLTYAAAMVGNSSSGIIEAASFALPVVNIGDRQRGRVHGPNVVDVPCSRAAIAAAVRHALEPETRRALAGMMNPYGSGNAAEAIVQTLRDVPLDEHLIVKRFWDLESAPVA